MYDTVRWTLLGILFVGLFGLWFWSRRQAAGKNILGAAIGSSFKILQKKWVDQKTGVCLVEAEDKTFLLAYTVGGGVCWQAVEKKAESSKEPTKEVKPKNRLKSSSLLPPKTR
jgi:hypothetical protein